MHAVALRFHEKLLSTMEENLSIPGPYIRADGRDHYRAAFTVSDDRFPCKQLLFYGRNVEILEPPEPRKTMIAMLKERMAAYRGKR